jgi:branched-chain amino acid transport system permease protein
VEAATLIQILVSGLLWGFVFSLVALGLTLIFGVMDVVNFAHGEFLMLAMYLAFWFSVYPGIDPILSLPAVVLLLAALGAAVHLLVIRHVLEAPLFAQMFSTFGLMLFLQGLAQTLWGPDYRAVANPIFQGVWHVGSIDFSKPQIVAASGAVIAAGLAYLFITRTRTGWSLQAVAQDRDAAALMGIPVQRAFTIAWMLGAALVGVAGGLLAEFYYIFPTVGSSFVNIAFATVALGGFGNVEGAFIAGILMGLVQSFGGYFISSALAPALIFAIYLLVVWKRPQGLLGKA